MEEDNKLAAFAGRETLTGFVDVPHPSVSDGVARALQAAYGIRPQYVPNDMLCMLAELDEV